MTTSSSNAFTANRSINNSLTPTQPMVKKYTVVFTSTVLSVNLAAGGQSVGNTLSPQSAVVDNSQGGSACTLLIDGVAYSVPQGSTETFPVLSKEFPDISLSATAPGTVLVALTNADMPASSSSASSIAALQGDLDKLAGTVGTTPQPTAMTTFSQPVIGGDEVTAANPLPVSGASGALTDVSGTIAAGGTSQVLQAAQITRKYIMIQNLSSGNLYLNFTSAATTGEGSYELLPNGVFTMEGNFVSNEAINIIGATTGQAFTAKVA